MADKRKKNEKPDPKVEEHNEKTDETVNEIDAGQDDASPEPNHAADARDDVSEADAQGTDEGTDGAEADETPESETPETPEPTPWRDTDDSAQSGDSAEESGPGDDADPSDDGHDAGDTVAQAPIPIAPPEPVVIRKGGFVPLFLGGIAAALIGFGAARYVLPEGWPWPGADDGAFEAGVNDRFDAQAAALNDLRGDLEEEAGKTPDLSPLQSDLDAVKSTLDTLGGTLETTTARLDALDTRLSDLEKRPVTEGVSPAAIAAYERELKALQEAMATQRAEVEKIAAEAAEKEANAEVTAQKATQRAALGRVLSALDTGAPFADAVDTLESSGVTVPADLSQVAADGVATRAELAQSFPDAARAALATARKGDGGGGLGAFLKTQLGARSIEPREGDDPDAVLSRAEAALNEGRLSDAMAELDALPEEARAELSEWLSRAATRVAALDAGDALASELN